MSPLFCLLEGSLSLRGRGWDRSQSLPRPSASTCPTGPPCYPNELWVCVTGLETLRDSRQKEVKSYRNLFLELHPQGVRRVPEAGLDRKLQVCSRLFFLSNGCPHEGKGSSSVQKG